MGEGRVTQVASRARLWTAGWKSRLPVSATSKVHFVRECGAAGLVWCGVTGRLQPFIRADVSLTSAALTLASLTTQFYWQGGQSAAPRWALSKSSASGQLPTEKPNIRRSLPSLFLFAVPLPTDAVERKHRNISVHTRTGTMHRRCQARDSRATSSNVVTKAKQTNK